MFERFVEEAVRSILVARDEARRLGHTSVGTVHLLLGAQQNDRKLAGLFTGRGRSVEDIRAAVEKAIGKAPVQPPADLPFSGDAQKAIAVSWSIAEELRHSTIVPLHLFLALLRIESRRVFEVLAALGIEPAEIAKAARDALTPSKPSGDRAGYHEEELEIRTPYGPITLTLVRLPNKNREEARIISLSAQSLNGPEEVGSFLADLDRLLDASSSGVTVTFFKDLFLGMGNKLDSYLQTGGT